MHKSIKSLNRPYLRLDSETDKCPVFMYYIFYPGNAMLTEIHLTDIMTELKELFPTTENMRLLSEIKCLQIDEVVIC